MAKRPFYDELRKLAELEPEKVIPSIKRQSHHEADRVHCGHKPEDCGSSAMQEAFTKALREWNS